MKKRENKRARESERGIKHRSGRKEQAGVTVTET